MGDKLPHFIQNTTMADIAKKEETMEETIARLTKENLEKDKALKDAVDLHDQQAAKIRLAEKGVIDRESVEVEGQLYYFTTDAWTDPDTNYTGGKAMTAKEAKGNLKYCKALIERKAGILVEA